jgi:endonuclease G
MPKKYPLLFWILILLLLIGIVAFMAFSIAEQLHTSPQNKEKNTQVSTPIDSSLWQNNAPYAYYQGLLDSQLRIHVALGIPYDKDTTDDFLLFRPQYALSYNKDLGIANWVSWELHAAWFGNSGRFQGNFLTDTGLPPSFYRAQHADYTHSGFDRGHIVRSHERTNSPENNRSTFFLSNCMPQHPDVNRGVWLAFEKYCESLCVDSAFKLQIIAGGLLPCRFKLANNQLCVPSAFFKIVYIDRTIPGPNRYTSLAVIIPNDPGLRKAHWRNFKTTIAKIETLTGYTYPNYTN